MGNGVIPYCRKVAVRYLKICGLNVSYEHSLEHHQLQLIAADIWVSILYGAGNLWLLWQEGMDLIAVILNLLCLLHAVFATCISRSEYFRTLIARDWHGDINHNAFGRVIAVELVGIGLSISAIISAFIPNADLVVIIAISANIILVLLDAIRVDLAIMFDASPT